MTWSTSEAAAIARILFILGDRKEPISEPELKVVCDLRKRLNERFYVRVKTTPTAERLFIGFGMRLILTVHDVRVHLCRKRARRMSRAMRNQITSVLGYKDAHYILRDFERIKGSVEILKDELRGALIADELLISKYKKRYKR